MPSQTASGKGFEYALAVEGASMFGAEILGDAQVAARNAYDSLTGGEQSERTGAARAALSFTVPTRTLIRDRQYRSCQDAT